MVPFGGLSELPLGRPLSFFQARAHIGARQRVFALLTGWGKSVGALTDVFTVVARLPIGAEATPELWDRGWCRPSGRRYPPRTRFAVCDVCGESLDIGGRARKSTQL